MSPFYRIPYLPQFDQMTPTNAAAALKKLLAEASQAVDALEAHHEISWSGLMRPLYDASYPLMDAWNILCHLLSVVNTREWRAVQETIQPELVAFSLRVGQSRAFYDDYLALQAADINSPTLTPTQRRILEKTIHTAEISGVGLAPHDQSRFNAIQTELATLALEFNNHALDATKAYSLLLTQADEVAGLPAALLAVTAQAARATDHPHATATTGPWRITLDQAVYQPFMMHSHNRPAREKLYRASVTRASCAPLDNTPIIERMLELRRAMAALLKCPHYAAISLESKTAHTVERVYELIEQLDLATRHAGEKEHAQLLAFAHQNGFTEAQLQPWDTAYYAERQREALYDYSDEELSHYFPFPRVLDGLFGLVKRLFNVTITAADGTAPLWHSDVRFFHVTDADGQRIASFYLDPYSRPATKRSGAWMNELRTRDRRPDSSHILPLALLVCNQSVPVDNKPSVMRFDEVNTLFHEFGHALQHILTTIEEPWVSGINGIEWDAVEIASQFMENWCFHPDTIKGLSQHIESGAELPDALFNKVVAAKNYRAATAIRRQLFLAATDLDLHAHYHGLNAPENPAAYSTADQVKQYNAAKYLAQPLLPEDRFLCNFGHIFGGGYAAGYYSYKWSEVASADIFAAFEEAGINDDAALRQTGARLRQTLMALGGSADPMQVFEQFRGRLPTIDALLRHSGLNT